MTNEEAIKMLNLVAIFPPEDPRTEAINMAREVLLRDIPAKPLFKLNDNNSNNTLEYEAYCPICKSPEGLYENEPYCSECGQRLDWSDWSDGIPENKST